MQRVSVRPPSTPSLQGSAARALLTVAPSSTQASAPGADTVTLGATTTAAPAQPPRLNIDPNKLLNRLETYVGMLPYEAAPPLAGAVSAAVRDVMSQARQLLSTNPTYIPMQLMSSVAKFERVHATNAAHDLRASHLDVPIGNFGVVEKDVLYRGTQPSRAGLRWLAAHGVKTVISLRRPQVEDHYAYVDFSSQEEAAECEKLGMRAVNIPISDEGLPQDEQVQKFLATMKDPLTGPAFVHCAAGVGRTGIMCGIFEREQGVPLTTVNRHLARFQLTPSTDAARRQLAYIANWPLS